MPAYLCGTARIAPGAQGFAAALAAAHGERLRPRCLCRAGGIEMYVARLGEGFIAKRMPNTGSQHAPDCPSYEPPPESSGLGQVLGTAIQEDPATGETMLKLGFAMSRLGGRASLPAPGRPSDRETLGGRLSLRGLLHYLWDQAELTRWQPGFTGKRTWGTVRRHLLMAAENKTAGGEALRNRLYVPEVFSVERRDELNARRIAQWQQAVAIPGKPQRLMLLIGEVKEIVPARYGFKAVVKHVPNQGFALDGQLYRRLGRCFGAELALWGSAEDVHMVVIASFAVNDAGIPTIAEMALMPVTLQWLPVADAFEKQLVEKLVSEGRSFIKGLRYNLGAASTLACATLTDCEGRAPLLFVAPPGIEDCSRGLGGPLMPAWRWHPTLEPMPTLPRAAGRHPVVSG